jgi:hypothetical protein
MAKKKPTIRFNLENIIKPNTRVTYTQPGNKERIIFDKIQAITIGYNSYDDLPIVLYRMSGTNYYLSESDFDVVEETKVSPTKPKTPKQQTIPRTTKSIKGTSSKKSTPTKRTAVKKSR